MRKVFFILYTILSFQILAQDNDHDHENEEHDHKHDHFHKNELGISLSPTIYLNEGEVSLGAHMHYIHRIGDSRFGAGLGFEAVFDDHKHRTFSTVFQWSPTYRTHICVAPGFVIAEHEHMGDLEKEYHWACHFEVIREFHLGPIDIGPFFEWALEEEDQHIGIGVHVGIPF